jgi:hypothetical protein
MSAAFRVTPPDDDKFFPVQALDLEPRTPVGLIPAIGALRYDALDTVFAGQSVELRAMPDLVIVLSQWGRWRMKSIRFDRSEVGGSLVGLAQG